MLLQRSYHQSTTSSNSHPNYWLIGALSVPVAYYTATLSYRYYVLRQRHALFLAYLAKPGNIPGSPAPLFSSLREAIKAREQGIWEWLFHQVVWKPLTGKVWWNGGFPGRAKSLETADESILPFENIDTARLVKNSRKASAPKDTGESLSATSSNDTSDDENWEKLVASKHDSSSGAMSPAKFEPTFTWIGQSTCLVQADGFTLLTDPVFSDKPIDTILAPSRLRPPACHLQDLIDLNIIDVCVVSHNHFDHLDEQAVKALGNSVHWIVPLGLKRFFVERDIDNERVVELDWWQEAEIPSQAQDKGVSQSGLQVSCVPAQHWSGRSPLDTNQTLWSGFIMNFTESGKRFFHCGDTGYSEDLFKAVGDVYGPVDLAAIPIGSYQPRWFMKIVHTDPEGAVRIHRHLGIKKTIGVHWGTWIISDERYDDPPKELERQLKRHNVPSSQFVTLPIGRTIEWN